MCWAMWRHIVTAVVIRSAVEFLLTLVRGWGGGGEEEFNHTGL